MKAYGAGRENLIWANVFWLLALNTTFGFRREHHLLSMIIDGVGYSFFFFSFFIYIKNINERGGEWSCL